ncbi:hypothetical protein ACSVDA_12025 [Cytobacillus sp. Hm23]
MDTLKTKLSSRKFWSMIIGFISSLLVTFNVEPNTAAQIIAIITSVSSVIIYILAEAYVDGKKVIVIQASEIKAHKNIN